MADSTILYSQIAVPLGIALGLSLTIERSLELISNISDYFHFGDKQTKIPPASEADAAMQKLIEKQKYDELRGQSEKEMQAQIADITNRISNETDPAKKNDLQAELAKLESSFDYDEKHHGPVVLIQKATDPDEGWTLKHFLTHVWGFAFGIVLAHFANVNLFGAMLKALDSTVLIPGWLDNIFTGLLIGSGSAPIHFLIGFISERKVTVPKNLDKTDTTVVAKKNDVGTNGEVAAPGSATAASAALPVITSVSTFAWKDIAYTGGVDAVVLDSIHRRPKKPDSIFYHHTAMSSKSTFDDVVRTIKNRTDSKGNHWVTGYHCVILADGSINPFCRWDRYGNQATGYNATSLGVSFNGNYETNPKIPFSNPDGRCGSPHPTEIQLESGARLTALWMHLYDIPLDLSLAVRPHNTVSDKTCPGSQFPYDQFKSMVTGFYSHWKSVPAIMEKISQFRLKPFIIDKNWR